MHGLGNKIKCKALYAYFKNKNLDIIFAQEVHCSNKNKQLWQTEWGSRWCISPGETNAWGVAIMFNPKSKIEVCHSWHDHEGRYVMCEIKVEDTTYTLCNLYAPKIQLKIGSIVWITITKWPNLLMNI